MRTMNFVRFFKKMGEVDLVYFHAGHENLSGQGPFRKEYRIDMESFANGNGFLHSYRDFRDRFRRLAERRPWVVTEWPKEAIEQLNDIVLGENYDFILCRYTLTSHPFLRYHGPLREKIMVDFDDVFSTSLFEAYAKRVPGTYAGLKWQLQRRMLLEYQKRCLTLGAAIFCSDEDREEVTGGNSLSNAYVVPNTFPTGEQIRNPDGDGYVNRRTLLFVGALDYVPNISGLKWFLESIFPGVKERYRDIRLLVVGRRPTEDLVAKCREYPGVELHPDVPDVGPYYERCGAVVIPLLSGGGTRIKILEAAMAGRPVLSTPLGAHGLGCVDGVQLMLFTDGESFLERYNRLDEETTYRGCVEKMHAVVEERYSPAAFDRAMEDVAQGILREKKGWS